MQRHCLFDGLIRLHVLGLRPKRDVEACHAHQRDDHDDVLGEGGQGQYSISLSLDPD
jgi:hypothetical protein